MLAFPTISAQQQLSIFSKSYSCPAIVPALDLWRERERLGEWPGRRTAAKERSSVRGLAGSLFASWVRSYMCFRKIGHIEMRVALGRVDAVVAEQLLHVTKISAGAKKMRGERMSQRVRRDSSRDARLARCPLHDPDDASPA